MCTPIVPLAGAINTLDETRERVGGWMGKGRLADKTTKVTNNYYGKDGVERTLATGDEETPAKNKNTLKVNPK